MEPAIGADICPQIAQVNDSQPRSQVCEVPFADGLLAGYGIAVPVGAIAVLIVETALRHGFIIGFLAGAGAAAADLFYAALAAIAGHAIASLLEPYSAWVRMLSGILLIALALNGILRLRREQGHPSLRVPASVGRLETLARFLGLTLLNPMTIAYFGALILARESAVQMTVGGKAAFVVGAGLASLSWQTLLALSGAVAKKRLPPTAQRLATWAGNLVILALGARALIGAVL